MTTKDIADKCKKGYDDSSTGEEVDPALAKDPSYLLGYREGLIKKMEWAKDDLEVFDKEYINSDPQLVEYFNIDSDDSE